MAIMLNQYSRREIEEFTWGIDGIHVTDWKSDAEKQECLMNEIKIEYRWEGGAYSLKETGRATFWNNSQNTARRKKKREPTEFKCISIQKRRKG